jgi:hypothetical protein
MTYTHSIPRTIPETTRLAAQCFHAAADCEDEVDLKQNRAAAIAGDYHDLVGLPGSDPANAGKQGELNQRRIAEIEAGDARRDAIEAGRKFNERAIDHLKSHFGRRWNPRWQSAGFNRGSLALPKNPMSLLLELRDYFKLNPEHEVAAIGVTAAQADGLAAAIAQAGLDESMAAEARSKARKARDAAFMQLRTRLVGLRAELQQLLDSDDPRWRLFGFARPIDRRTPQPVDDLTLRPGAAPDEIIVEWPAAVGADNYRVLRQVDTVDPEPIEVGIFTDGLAIIRNLPGGKIITVSVTARNPKGETAATTQAISIGTPPADQFRLPNERVDRPSQREESTAAPTPTPAPAPAAAVQV